MKSMKHLDLKFSRGVSDQGLKYLLPLSDLESLAICCASWRFIGEDSVEYRECLTDAGLRTLTEFKNLKTLEIQGGDFTAKGLSGFQEKMPQCEVQLTAPL